jgi:hypothetical protein
MIYRARVRKVFCYRIRLMIKSSKLQRSRWAGLGPRIVLTCNSGQSYLLLLIILLFHKLNHNLFHMIDSNKKLLYKIFRKRRFGDNTRHLLRIAFYSIFVLWVPITKSDHAQPLVFLSKNFGPWAVPRPVH